MDGLVLYIANKNYSSWSMRPWLAMTAAGIDFEEVLTPFDDTGGNVRFREFSPTGKVPVLHHGSLQIWESLAIIEYVAELYPEAGIWPYDPADRALARSISMEMLAGFRALRGACPMNIRRQKKKIDVGADVTADIGRITQIWRTMRQRSGGPFLFGTFSAADAMYAPVVNRLDVYDFELDADALDYMQAVQSHPAWIKWREAALAESWVVPADEA
ncbi:glutathione S-transferase family protein [Rhizobium sp. SSA_523]|uniref:glutathione S-transferase family protein n=1 Tax=Rhizobium sp. SSA_523 TaxID=2952477 RepID=UPI0020916B98|nr:glutathione S-transferase family protein [Rhizobium sp. SSA_523]MCO5733470.1 glutathione S-transferase family protein [Rhizobium sp. SSA_523]WKC23223.1 glutathione S-transferase family protein [Rhizobium sp. SSA_523]